MPEPSPLNTHITTEIQFASLVSVSPEKYVENETCLAQTAQKQGI